MIRGNALVWSFSTLYGSKWVATLMPLRAIALWSGFSTLYGSKWVATVHPGIGALALPKFQYPLRVEVGCNQGVSGDPTPSAKFQYPLRVEVGCNLPLPSKVIPTDASFSTLYGSKWVATRRQRWTGKRVPGFGTLYGSKWVATLVLCVVRISDNGFSTLYGSKWVATWYR